jgi:hypothetical protein
MLLFEDRLKCVAGLRNVREVELRLQLFLAVTFGSSLRLRPISTALTEVRFHLLRFINADGTGMSFLFCDADLREHVKNRPALDLELSRQIVNSNLIHPSSYFLPQTR